ncbi:MAG: motility associated factor glycosyltransferase family protein [Lachnospiraceae bacterium]|nr:motility associated factor glycosyltransferase family protein [Lachnospiraceae bacterium]
MTIYEKNLNVLARAYPQMDRLIEEARKTAKPDLEIQEERAWDGEVILKVKKDGRTCYLNGKRNTKEAARIWAGGLEDLPNNAPIFLMGVGNPFYLQEVTERNQNRLTILVYEPSLQIFLKFLEHVPLKEWMEKHVIVFWVHGLEGMDDKAMDLMIKHIIQYEKISYSGKMILPNYEVLFPEEAVNFMRIIRDHAKQEMIQYSTKKLFASVIVKNLFSNARYLCDGYKTTQLVDVIPRDIPGIVIAAGPSLNKNIQELKKAKGRAFIVAVDTAIKPLLDAGILPDMFAIVDGKKQFSLVEREEAKEIPLVTSLNAASDVLDYHTGMKFFYNEGFTFADTILMKHEKAWGGVSTGGSVATSAFSLLHKIGLKRIILVGQDLAYTGHKSHADGTFEKVMKEETDRKYIMVEGNEEKEVPTTLVLQSYLEWYNQHIKRIREVDQEFRVINATEGGAKIDNTEIMTLQEAIERECTKEVNIQECLGKLPPMLDEKEREWAKGYLREIPKRFQELGEDAGTAENLYQKLDRISRKKHLDQEQYLAVLKKIKKITKKMEANVMYQMIDITMVEAQYIMRDEQFTYEDTLEAEGRAMARKGMLYTRLVKDMSGMFEEYTKFYQ